MAQSQRRIENAALFICDVQEKFRSVIHEYPKVIATAQKMIRASKILNIPVLATTQNRARLGDTCAELGLDVDPSSNGDAVQTAIHANKTLFSMCTPELMETLAKVNPSGSSACVIVGIESHICVTQTTIDLLKAGHKVYVLADGVSSCNKEEVPIALDRLRREGAVVTTSESWLYEYMGDASIPEFKQVAKLVRETAATTREVMQTLCKL